MVHDMPAILDTERSFHSMPSVRSPNLGLLHPGCCLCCQRWSATRRLARCSVAAPGLERGSAHCWICREHALTASHRAHHPSKAGSSSVGLCALGSGLPVPISTATCFTSAYPRESRHGCVAADVSGSVATAPAHTVSHLEAQHPTDLAFSIAAASESRTGSTSHARVSERYLLTEANAGVAACLTPVKHLPERHAVSQGHNVSYMCHCPCECGLHACMHTCMCTTHSNTCALGAGTTGNGTHGSGTHGKEPTRPCQRPDDSSSLDPASPLSAHDWVADTREAMSGSRVSVAQQAHCRDGARLHPEAPSRPHLALETRPSAAHGTRRI